MNQAERIEDEQARQGARLDELRGWLAELGVLLVHVHADLVGLREHWRLYDPACYADGPRDADAGGPGDHERSGR
jgi:hypothetical protein